jgi:hypothetical protein
VKTVKSRLRERLEPVRFLQLRPGGDLLKISTGNAKYIVHRFSNDAVALSYKFEIISCWGPKYDSFWRPLPFLTAKLNTPNQLDKINGIQQLTLLINRIVGTQSITANNYRDGSVPEASKIVPIYGVSCGGDLVGNENEMHLHLQTEVGEEEGAASRKFKLGKMQTAARVSD